MDLKTNLRRNANSSFQIAEGKAVVMLAVNSNIFTLNEIGTVIWELLEHPMTVGELVKGAQAKFPEDDPEIVREDIREFIKECLKEQLLIQED